MADYTTLAKLKDWLGIGQVTENADIPAAPGPYTITVSQAAAWSGSAGVTYALTGAALEQVAAAPAAGQYAVSGGVYTFNAADAGKAVVIAYVVTGSDDALLARLVTAATRNMVQYLGWDVLSQSYSIVRDGDGGAKLVLPYTPVTGVSLVKVDGTAIPAAGGATDSGFRFSSTLLYLRGYSFTKGVQNVEVTFTAGYAALPADLEQACLEICGLRYKDREHIGQSSKALGDGQTVAFVTQALPAWVKETLDRYKRVVPA